YLPVATVSLIDSCVENAYRGLPDVVTGTVALDVGNDRVAGHIQPAVTSHDDLFRFGDGYVCIRHPPSFRKISVLENRTATSINRALYKRHRRRKQWGRSELTPPPDYILRRLRLRSHSGLRLDAWPFPSLPDPAYNSRRYPGAYLGLQSALH